MVSLVQLVVLLSFVVGGGLPLGLPPGPEDPAAAAVAPEDCLLYLSWAGTAKPDPKSENALEQLLAEVEVRQLAAEVERRIREALRKGDPDAEPDAAKTATKTADDIADLVKKALTSPAAGYVTRLELGDRSMIQAGAIVGLGEDAARIRAVWERLATESPGVYQPVTIAGETLWSLPTGLGAPSVTLGVYGTHFVLGVGEGEAQAIVQRMKGKPPAWLAQLRRQLPVQRPSSVTYVNMNLILGLTSSIAFFLPEESAGIRALGLENFTSLGSVSGMEGSGLVTKTLLGTTKPDGDVFSFLNAKPLEAADLAPIPKDATLAKAVRIDADRFWGMILDITGKIDPGSGQYASAEIATLEGKLGLKIRDDILRPLGDTWCVYSSPGEGGLVFTGLTAVARLKDPSRAAKTHEKLVSWLKEEMERQRGRNPRDAWRIEEHAVAGRTVYTYIVPAAIAKSYWPAPSWCLTDKELIVALFPQQVTAYLSRGPEFQSLAARPEVAELLRSQPGPMVVGYVDTADVFRTLYPLAQVGAQYLVRELRRQGIDVDASLLPSAASIQKHLRPSLYAVRRSPAGIEIITRQSLPGAGMTLLLPMRGFMVSPFHSF
jgi:hypothetical protein